MRRVVAHVFVEDVAAPAVEVGEGDFHHLSRVLRLSPGEAVSASDGAGWSRLCIWTGAPLLEPAGDAVFEPRPEPEIAVGFALTKGAHPEWAVQKLTEAGVDRVVLMTTAHCVARWAPPDVPRRLGRLREVARQAAMQSRRSWLPVVEGPVAFPELVGVGRAGVVQESTGGYRYRRRSAGAPPAGTPPAGAAPAGLVSPAAPCSPASPAGVALAVPNGATLSLATPTVLVGPEGGWAGEELDAVRTHVALGPHVLRAETAALAAGLLLAALRAGLVDEASARPAGKR